jgi:hypothetical protein
MRESGGAKIRESGGDAGIGRRGRGGGGSECGDRGCGLQSAGSGGGANGVPNGVANISF